MSDNILKYRLSDYALGITVILAIAISWLFKWSYTAYPLNFMGGDAKDYYSGLVSLFITHDFTSQTGNDWFLLKTSTGVINVHPIGVSVLLLPFFGIACLLAYITGAPVDGFSIPFQVSVGFAALCYALLGLFYIKKLFMLHGIGDKTTALILLLLFFGTNLLNYTLSEAGMSHVYSFSMIAVFLYHSSRFILKQGNRDLLSAFLILGLIILIRPNNVLILFSVFIWFRSLESCKQFFKALFRNKMFYMAALLCMLIVFSQSLVWFVQSKRFFHNTYKADGFYWLDPQVVKMLFGFDGGFFIYTPLCLFFLAGLVVIYRESKFAFLAAVLFLSGLFYFFASYWAYNYFDGLGIRVLVDYYALFSFIGAKLFAHFLGKTVLYNALVLMALCLAVINMVYCYQANRGILLRTGMTYAKWKYIFMRTGAEYQDVLGGSHEMKPYSAKEQEVVLQDALPFQSPFDYSGRDYGLTLSFDSIGFSSNRIHMKIDCRRKELFVNSSKDVLLCVALEDGRTHASKSYSQCRLNEAPSRSCCEPVEYNYTANITADFQPGDKLSVFLWNRNKQPFLVDKFAVQVYDYGFQIN